MAYRGGRTFRLAAAALLSAGIVSAAHAASANDLDRPLSDAELRKLASAYQRGDLGAGRCAWVHPVTNGPTTLPCEVVPLPVIARMARNPANKNAQLELGKRYEAGRGVAQDLAMARRYYRMAARDNRSGSPIIWGRTELTRPKVLGGGELAAASMSGIGGKPVSSRMRAAGLPEAQERLRKLSKED